MEKINILVVGSGGREHALAWKINKSPLVDKLYCAPGNAGTGMLAQNVDIGADDITQLADFAGRENIGLTVVGPEAPLCGGIVDLFKSAGLKIFGPEKNAALIEGSKAFMKDILQKAGVPTARYEKHDDSATALESARRFGGRVVVKADGLAGGKGVVVCDSLGEAERAINAIMVDRQFGGAGATVILEELLEGEEASMLAFCDGSDFVMMPSAKDHKRIGDGDTGPNTGGMGAYSPAPVITREMAGWIEKNVMAKIMTAMKDEGRPYSGILYAGLMITADGPKVLEFNCRFGDPECQPILMRMDSDIVPVLLACAEGRLAGVEIKWSASASACVVMASGGYPGPYKKGMEIHGLEAANAMENVVVFHAGTRMDGGRVVTAGGRAVGVSATGANINEAVDRAYSAVNVIKWDGVVYRKDIGRKTTA